MCGEGNTPLVEENDVNSIADGDDLTSFGSYKEINQSGCKLYFSYFLTL